MHRAVSHDGRQLAVKVQHAGLRETAHADIVTIELLVGALHYVLPDFDYSWLVETTKENLPLVTAPRVPEPCLRPTPLEPVPESGWSRLVLTPGPWIVTSIACLLVDIPNPASHFNAMDCSRKVEREQLCFGTWIT